MGAHVYITIMCFFTFLWQSMQQTPYSLICTAMLSMLSSTLRAFVIASRQWEWMGFHNHQYSCVHCREASVYFCLVCCIFRHSKFCLLLFHFLSYTRIWWLLHLHIPLCMLPVDVSSSHIVISPVWVLMWLLSDWAVWHVIIITYFIIVWTHVTHEVHDHSFSCVC